MAPGLHGTKKIFIQLVLPLNTIGKNLFTSGLCHHKGYCEEKKIKGSSRGKSDTYQ
jgi:hypothetical protein